jgi:hypothetical protein
LRKKEDKPHKEVGDFVLVEKFKKKIEVGGSHGFLFVLDDGFGFQLEPLGLFRLFSPHFLRCHC